MKMMQLDPHADAPFIHHCNSYNLEVLLSTAARQISLQKMMMTMMLTCFLSTLKPLQEASTDDDDEEEDDIDDARLSESAIFYG